MNDEPVVCLRDLCYSIDNQEILHSVCAQFADGKIHGIVGPNGAGKSTLLRNICRIWKPESGSIKIFGKDQRTIARRELSCLVTLVPQELRIDFSIRVFDFVAMGRHPHVNRLQWLKERDVAIIQQALELTGAAQFCNRNINQLSGGECQLVSISRALATEAKIILLDEPTSALDIQHKLQIMHLLNVLKNQGKTILMNIHDLELARRYCDTLTMLRHGNMYYQGSVEHAFQPQHIREVFDVEVEERETAHGVSLLFYEKG